ncbi:MAG: hypothetical protein HY901_02640 [Deltaproteobacteria bacterium]|nr:hypothetical protein [Deltaproteobacteria bacterium]
MANMMPKELNEYLKATMEHGLVAVDNKGKHELTPRVRAVIDALHEVLAGGEVTISLKTPGNTHRKQLLTEKMNTVLAAASENPAGSPEPYGP